MQWGLYHCEAALESRSGKVATLINYNSNLSICGTFLNNLLPPPDIRE